MKLFPERTPKDSRSIEQKTRAWAAAELERRLKGDDEDDEFEDDEEDAVVSVAGRIRESDDSSLGGG